LAAPRHFVALCEAAEDDRRRQGCAGEKSRVRLDRIPAHSTHPHIEPSQQINNHVIR